MPHPPAVLFDLGATVLQQDAYHPQAGLKRLWELSEQCHSLAFEELQQLGEEYSTEIRAQRRHLEHGATLIELNFRAVLRALVEHAGLTFRDQTNESLEHEFWQASSQMSPLPGVAETLQFLSDAKIAIGMISNSAFSQKVLRAELGTHNLDRFFPWIMSSRDYGLRKPHRFLFEIALQKLDLPADQVWYVGDHHRNDVAGSRAAGLIPVWFSPRSEPADETCLRLNSWHDFPALWESVH